MEFTQYKTIHVKARQRYTSIAYLLARPAGSPIRSVSNPATFIERQRNALGSSLLYPLSALVAAR